jgi:tRNA dimethylallyltransferase
VNRASTPRAIAICGPTSSGKSEIAVVVAETVGGEIVNADSRQVYRDLPVGTGAPPQDLMQRVPHHLFGFVDPCERYSAGEYVRDAIVAIDGIIERGRVPIVVGGTGLYVEALAGTMPLDRPVADEDVRRRVKDEALVHPQEFLHEWLNRMEPSATKRVPAGDRYRTLRALEAALVVRAAPTPSPAGSEVGEASRRVAMRVAVLGVDEGELRRRIHARVRAMYDNGLVEEAVAVWRRCAGAPALTGLGFAEALGWYRGEATRAEALAATITRTVRYARRQRTWFRRMRNAFNVDAADRGAAAAAIASLARETLQST